MKPEPIAGPGHVVADMRRYSLYAHDQLHADYEVQKIVEWVFDDEAAAQAFREWLARVSSSAGQAYTSNSLIIIADPVCTLTEDGEWWPCAYSSDGGGAGVCEVRLKWIVEEIRRWFAEFEEKPGKT